MVIVSGDEVESGESTLSPVCHCRHPDGGLKMAPIAICDTLISHLRSTTPLGPVSKVKDRLVVAAADVSSSTYTGESRKDHRLVGL